MQLYTRTRLRTLYTSPILVSAWVAMGSSCYGVEWDEKFKRRAGLWSETDQQQQATESGEADAGRGGEDGAGRGGQGTGTHESPSQDPAAQDEAHAVFVNGSQGNDSHPGTQDKPMQSIQAAARKAKSEGKQYVNMCTQEGLTYPAQTLEGIEGLAITGGYACSSWQYGKGQAHIQGDDIGLTLKHAKHVTLIDLEIEGKSNIGMWVEQANGLTLKHVKVVSGDGKDGANGQTGSNYEQAQAPNGKNASESTGGEGGTVTCKNGQTSSGGKGGTNKDKDFDMLIGQPGTASTDQVWKETEGKGGEISDNGFAGGKGRDGEADVGATEVVVTLEDGALKQSSGASDGQDGFVGQGGGGGGAAKGGGGGGGSGGCGGAGGTAGQDGQPSVAIFSDNSEIKIDDKSELSPGNSGRGGKGGQGQKGQSGGQGGDGNSSGAQGGQGGDGGDGSAGMDGAKGLRIGIAYRGNPPTLDGNVGGSRDTDMLELEKKIPIPSQS